MLKRVVFVCAMALSLWFVSRLPVAEANQAHQDDMPAMQDESKLPLETRQLIDDVRGATADFRDVETAEKAGYAIFQDCFNEEGVGGMGQHYVNGDLAGDDVVDPLKPEALVYEPREDGKLILVALEYLVFADKWTKSDPPTAFGQDFHLVTDIPNTPPVWALHIWLWSHNTLGLFTDYNPIVFCPANVKTQS
ncbi:MAG: hypothetical protein ABI690_17000 [Chloroflexota bacterium]